MDDVEIPAKPVARADAGECQDRDDQHGEQPRRNNRSGPARGRIRDARVRRRSRASVLILADVPASRLAVFYPAGRAAPRTGLERLERIAMLATSSMPVSRSLGNLRDSGRIAVWHLPAPKARIPVPRRVSPRDEVKSTVDGYTAIYNAGPEHRREHYRSFVNRYYDLVTDFYEFGWGQSFHFAPRRRGESFKASLLRHQRFLADRLSLKPGMEVLDVGCGVGGPMGNLARHTGASFVGINNNAYQIERAKLHTRDVLIAVRLHPRRLHADSGNATIATMPPSPSNPCRTHPTRQGRSGRSSASCARGRVSRATSGVSPRISIRGTQSTCASRTTS